MSQSFCFHFLSESSNSSWEVNQGLQSIKSTTISFLTSGLLSQMSNCEPFEQELERMNTEVVPKKRVRAGHRCH